MSQVKLIAEPWDVGPGGYQVGNFPVLWTEWNGKYRDCVRRFWKGDGGTRVRARHAARPAAATSTRTAAAGRTPASTSSPRTTASRCTTSSATTRSTTRPTAKSNRDGANDNLSWNCGVEGPTDDPAINALRARQKRNLLATLLLSQGVPMLCGGDELGHTQHGNNNAYCQDNEHHLARLGPRPTSSSEFLRVHAQAGAPPAVAAGAPPPQVLPGPQHPRRDVKDISWLAPDGREMTDEAWNADFVRCLGVRLTGDAIDEVNERGEPIVGDTLLILLNAHSDAVPFTLPPLDADQQWQRILDTRDPATPDRTFKPGARYPLAGRSVAVLQGDAAGPRASPRARRGARRHRGARTSRDAGDAGAGRRGRVTRRSASRSRVASRTRRTSRAVATRSDDRPTPTIPTIDSHAASSSRTFGPRVDDGRFPIKRTAGESVDVHADVFADGHDVLAVIVRDRPAPANDGTTPQAAGARRR